MALNPRLYRQFDCAHYRRGYNMAPLGSFSGINDSNCLSCKKNRDFFISLQQNKPVAYAKRSRGPAIGFLWNPCLKYTGTSLSVFVGNS